MQTPLKLGVFCDLLEERWFSMDLLGDMLLENGRHHDAVLAERIRPSLPPLLARWATAPRERPRARWAYRAAISFGRYCQYPVQSLWERRRHDFFHIVDHSYGHLLFELPPERTGIYCHDLDAYRPALEAREGGLPFRVLAAAQLAALKRARVVFHSSLAVRDQILAHGLVPEERLVHAPYGVASEFQPQARGEDAALAGQKPFVMHVGSLIPRKNPEFLLKVMIEVCRAAPELEVLQVGGTFSEAQRAELAAAGVAERVRQVAHMKRPELSAHLRAARGVILPSLAEGFGLPVVEALACGAPIVVSDIPVLKEVGGGGVVVRPTDDVRAWRDAVLDIANGGGPGRDARLRAAARYTWSAHATTILDTYARLRPPP